MKLFRGISLTEPCQAIQEPLFYLLLYPRQAFEPVPKLSGQVRVYEHLSMCALQIDPFGHENADRQKRPIGGGVPVK